MAERAFRRRRARKVRDLIIRVFPLADYRKGMTTWALSDWESAQAWRREWQAAKQEIQAADRQRQADGADRSEDTKQHD
jgi:hypothetical protein